MRRLSRCVKIDEPSWPFMDLVVEHFLGRPGANAFRAPVLLSPCARLLPDSKR